MTIGDVCEFKVRFEDADFWLIRKGSESVVGKPVKEYSPEHIGVKIIDREMFDPQYLYYLFMAFHQNRFFEKFAHGTIKLKHINIRDIKSIPIKVV